MAHRALIILVLGFSLTLVPLYEASITLLSPPPDSLILFYSQRNLADMGDSGDPTPSCGHELQQMSERTLNTQLKVELLLLCVGRIWFGHLPRERYQACASRGRPPGQT